MVEKLAYLSNEHHFALAAVATRSSQMEHMIELAFSVALREQPKLAEYALKNLGADRIVGALEAALQDRKLPNPETVGETVARIKAARSSRNEMLHWIYGVAEDETLARIATLRPFRKPDEKHLTAEQFQAVADEMLSICSALHALIEHCYRQDELRRTPLPKLSPASSVTPAPKGLAQMFAPPHPLPSSQDNSENE